MTTQVSITLDEYKKKAGGYAGMLLYRYCNICVKADPAALLSTSILSGNGVQRIEDVTAVCQGDDDYTLELYPYENKKIPLIMKSILMEHPEFKLDVYKRDEKNREAKPERAAFPEDLDKSLFILLTVPDVDKDRRDLLKDLSNTMYHDSERGIDQATATFKPKLVALAKDEEKEEVDALKEEVDKIHKTSMSNIDNLREKKLRDIEDAYQHFKEKHPDEKEQSKTAQQPKPATQQPKPAAQQPKPDAAPQPKLSPTQSIKW